MVHQEILGKKVASKIRTLLRTFEPQIMKNFKKLEPRQKLSGSYNKNDYSSSSAFKELYFFRHAFLLNFRLHEKNTCYQFGSVFNGMVRERKTNTGSCNGMRPKPDSWSTMRVQINSKNEAQFYINNVFIASHIASIPWYPRGGVVVANGYKNIIMFREFRIFAKK